MKPFIKIVIAAVVLFAAPKFASAQKVGHLNVDSMLKIWPAYQKIVDSLTAYQLNVQNQVRKMQLEYDAKLREIDSTKNISSETIMRLRYTQLQQIEDNLNAYVELESQQMQDLQVKMVDTLYKQLNKAISAVAKEKGYAYILDSSKGGQVMYSDPAYDVFDAVRIKLNIPVPKPKPTPAPGGGAPAPAPNK